MNTAIATNFSSALEPGISIIVCTRNRCSKLQKCLDEIEKIQKDYDFELVVIDNNSTDDTLTIISNHARTSKIPMRWCTETKKGLGAARNRGAEVAQSEILVYLDDDCYPAIDLVTRYQKIFSQSPNLGFVSGRVELYNSNDLPITILTFNQERFFPAQARLHAGEIIGANIGIRRSAFKAVNGWDELFGAGTDFPCEDLDMAARILCAGWQGKYDPKPLVYHDHGRKTAAEAKALMEYYDAGRGGFYSKCMLNRALRKVYLWSWIKGFRRQKPMVIYREIKSFINYLVHR